MANTSPWSVPVRVEDVPLEGLHREITADAQTRQAIAETAGLRALTRLDARFELTRRGADGLHVRGDISATVGQNCVVSLEPLENEIAEDFDLVFAPAAGPAGQKSHQLVDLDDDQPEVLQGGAFDLGALAVEFLLLGVDPYPRKAGVAFGAATPVDEGEHPFAALAALKREKNGNEGGT